eukprot:TRINITY_DN1013_c0_g1_i3.p1 TRINITY_DN1013_c0_g1~~TRINITY_DN1013_c0_g1_i3.p1  ORF type:complete len:238 (-),score=58.59 TRINITY_DN1013_c0_g1_i3:64-777(-)
MLKTLLAFASGGLLGDVFLHLLPHALEQGGGHSHQHDGAHDHTQSTITGLLILLGMFIFFMLEKLAVLKNGHGHSHSGNKDHEQSSDQSRKRVSAILNIIADATHNFTDGMAIAASFMVSQKIGMITTIAVLFHEIPHEIGDLALLVQGGFSKTQVIFIQFLTAFGALAGTLFGIVASDLDASSSWMLPITAGGFVYIATVDVLPELFEETNLKQTVCEILALLVGVGMMVVIALIE